MRFLVCALLLVLMMIPAWKVQSQENQTAEQQKQAAQQQNQTAEQQNQTAQQQQNQTAEQQNQTAQQQSQTAQQQSETAQQQSRTAQQQSQAAQQILQAQRAQEQSQNGTDRADTAEVKAKQADRLHEAEAVLKAALNEKTGISKNLTDKAKCVIIIPSVKRLAVGLGVDYGRGAMTCRLGEDFNGPWSAPSMVALEGGNFGLQFGAQATDLVLLVLNERGVNSLLRSRSKLGGDVSVAAGPIGRSFTAATDLGMRAQILAYSHTGGVFAGIALNGSTLRPDTRGNESLYGRELTAKDIVRSGQVRVPRDARPLIQMLEQSSNVAAAPPSGGK